MIDRNELMPYQTKECAFRHTRRDAGEEETEVAATAGNSCAECYLSGGSVGDRSGRAYFHSLGVRTF